MCDENDKKGENIHIKNTSGKKDKKKTIEEILVVEGE